LRRCDAAPGCRFELVTRATRAPQLSRRGAVVRQLLPRCLGSKRRLWRFGTGDIADERWSGRLESAWAQPMFWGSNRIRRGRRTSSGGVLGRAGPRGGVQPPPHTRPGTENTGPDVEPRDHPGDGSTAVEDPPNRPGCRGGDDCGVTHHVCGGFSASCDGGLFAPRVGLGAFRFRLSSQAYGGTKSSTRRAAVEAQVRRVPADFEISPRIDVLTSGEPARRAVTSP